jgi:hypothetical protein
MADDNRPPARPRPPMPPVPPPVTSRPPAAPFAASSAPSSPSPSPLSPSPGREALRPTATALDERRPVGSALPGIPSPAGPPLVSQPVPELPSRPVSSWSDDDHGAPWSTGRGEIRAPREQADRPEGVPFVERRASRLPAGGIRPSTGPGESPVYGDWTKPSGPGRVPSAPVPPLPPVPPAPLTSAIPDRDLSGRDGSADLDRFEDDRFDDGLDDDRLGDDRFDGRVQHDRHDDDRFDDRFDDRYDDERHDRDHVDDGDLATPGPVTGTVVGGRAALRAEREAREAARVAAETARRKAAGDLDDDRPRRPRRLLKGLVAVAAVGAVVLGVYTVASPGTEETGATNSVTPSSSPTTAPTSAPEVTAALPELDTEPSVAESSAPAAPVRVPVTVLNSTDIDGLAAGISEVIEAKGWQTAKPGGYPKDDVAVSTVFFTEGDEKQRQAALQLVEQFPELAGPVVRFFEVPDVVEAPGLVVVAAGDWKP